MSTANTPATKADLEALRNELLEMMRLILQATQVNTAFRLADQINAQHPTTFTENDVERLVHEVRTEATGRNATK